jgi:organic hydroperoxide reductase OsmC/OhrA
MSKHIAKINWSRAGAVFSDAKYPRAHLISFDGGVSIAGSSAPESVRPPLSKVDAADPEELLVAAVASCHMLWFLDYARKAGFIVNSYEDNPHGRLAKDDDGIIRITLVTLVPKVEFEGIAPAHAELEELHHKAHDICFIANSLRCPVIVEPVTA